MFSIRYHGLFVMPQALPRVSSHSQVSNHSQATHSTLKKHIDPFCKLVFCRRWGLVGVLEAPRCAPYYLAARAPHFAWQHDLGPRDTLASVALRYHCDMVVLRRYNNLMSEAGVACRTQLYVPGKKGWGGRLASGGPTIAALKIACQSPAPPCAVPCRSVRPGAGQGLRGRLCALPARRAALCGRVCAREGPAPAPGPRDAAAGERQDHPHAGAQSPHRPLHGPVLPQQPLPEPARRHLGIRWV